MGLLTGQWHRRGYTPLFTTGFRASRASSFGPDTTLKNGFQTIFRRKAAKRFLHRSANMAIMKETNQSGKPLPLVARCCREKRF